VHRNNNKKASRITGDYAMTKSMQLSYVCWAFVPNQNHCMVQAPG
jgi:hypothetical protein